MDDSPALGAPSDCERFRTPPSVSKRTIRIRDEGGCDAGGT